MQRRNMLNLTGVPGWMRFGFSPGRGGGRGPCAQYLLTGQWPTPQVAAAWQATQAGDSAPVGNAVAHLRMLKAQAEMLEAQLEQVRGSIAGLEDGQPEADA